jgi:hypothetical protein
MCWYHGDDGDCDSPACGGDGSDEPTGEEKDKEDES